uniref:Uncharacterized protein n=1 Tax=Oryza barthii TaxID=65489 RepID=A0A0D3F548_9ORYZ
MAGQGWCIGCLHASQGGSGTTTMTTAFLARAAAACHNSNLSLRDVQRILAISEIYNGDACMTITGEMNQELIYNFSGLYATAQRKAPARRRRRNHAPRLLLSAVAREWRRRISNGRAVAMAGKRRQRRTVSHATHLLLLLSPNSLADVGLLLPAAVLRLLLCPCPLEFAASTHELATTERAKATALPALTASSSPALACPPPAPVPRPPLAERKRMREGGG